MTLLSLNTLIFVELIPPILSFGYALLATCMTLGSNEHAGSPIRLIVQNSLVPLMFRAALVGVYYELITNKFPKIDDKYNQRIFILLSGSISLRLSYKLIQKTKCNVVDGGCLDNIKKVLYHHNNNDTDTLNMISSSPFFNSEEDLIFIITGANSGIGKETAIQLALLSTQRTKKNAKTTIILACRTIEKGIEVKNEIINNVEQYQQQIKNSVSIQKSSDTKPWNDNLIIDCIELELCSYQSIRNAVRIIQDKYPCIHGLINNAGVMMKDYIVTKHNQHETTIQANHLGHFLWTCLLLPIIIPNPMKNKNIHYVPRILNLTSSLYTLVSKQNFPFNDLNCTQRPYSMFQQYGVSKLCNILFTYCLAMQYPTIFTASIHPGTVRTNVVRNMPWFMKYGNTIFSSMLQSVQKTPYEGCWTTIDLIAFVEDTSPMNSGNYWFHFQTKPIVYNTMKNNENKKKDVSRMEQDAIDLWHLSCSLVGLTDIEMKQIQDLASNTLKPCTDFITIATTNTTDVANTVNDSKLSSTEKKKDQ